MPFDPTGLYRSGPMHVLVVERDGELELHSLMGLASLPPETTSRAAIDHAIEAGRLVPMGPAVLPRVVLAQPSGPWLVLGSSCAPDDLLPSIHLTETPVGYAARLAWYRSGQRLSGTVLTGDSTQALIAELRPVLARQGWLVVEVRHA